MKAGTRLVVLGSGQDGGIPHAGCLCPACERARKDARFRRLAPSIAVGDEEAGFCYLIDASPDLGPQLNTLRQIIPAVKRDGRIPVSGIFLTHAHFGHYTGLLLLGTEVLAENAIPVYCTERMGRFLSDAPPFSLLLRNRNIVLNEVHPNMEVVLDGVSFTPIAVPHRGEITDTVGYTIRARRRVEYIPDTDCWTQGLVNEIADSDIALVDGTFFSRSEVARFEDTPHPPIEEALRALDGAGTRIYFTHINHTNPVNSEGRERGELETRGFTLAYDGLTLQV
jgi:pyrroloquinoline quinone biosynthesis protein B